MNEPKRPSRRGRTRSAESPDIAGDDNPYRDAPEAGASTAPPPRVDSARPTGDDVSGGGVADNGAHPDRPARPRRGRPPRDASLNGESPAADVDAAPREPRALREPRAARTPRPERGAEARSEEGSSEERAARAEGAERMERPERAERPERVERPERSARAPRAERLERVERPERVEQQDRAEPAPRAASLERDPGTDSGDFTQRLERLDRMDRIERGETVDRPVRPARPERVERPERFERDARAERPVERSGERPFERAGEREPDRGGDRPPRLDRGDRPPRPDRGPRQERGGRPSHPRGERPVRDDRGFAPVDRAGDRGPDRNDPNDRNGLRRNGRRGRNRFRRGGAAPIEQGEPRVERAPVLPTVVDGTMSGWFDVSRDGGFLRRAVNSYLPDPADPFISPALVRLHQLRRGDALDVNYGRDHRGRAVVIEVLTLNDGSPVVLDKRPDFNTLTASYPDRKLTLETGRPAKGPELTRRAIDLIAPIGYGQRALIVAPARAGKTTLLQAIVEGVAINHPEAVLIVLLVDERPEEVSEMVEWGYGEVVSSSFDMPPKRHVEVADMALERARRQVEMGKDVVIVLDSITRLARAHNTVERGTGRTMSGGLDSNAMQKPKAFFGSARMIAKENGGGSLTIISTALVETGSRMDDVIFEEFKGTGNCEIKLDRSLADRRIFPAFDIATSGTRREEKLYRPDQLEKVHLLRRGLHQMPPQAAMEWLIKRIAATTNNDSLLDGL
jgi:transcription termination factor Rho